MHRTRKIIVGAAALGAALGGAGIAGAVSSSGSDSDDSEGHVTGAEADKATAAALEATGGGTANAVERDDEKGATWEVEITKPDGTTVDVRLDEGYKVLVIDDDSETADDGDATG